MPLTDSIYGLPLRTAADAALSAKPSEIEREVMELFEQFRRRQLDSRGAAVPTQPILTSSRTLWQ
jgi:hypothetical protein